MWTIWLYCMAILYGFAESLVFAQLCASLGNNNQLGNNVIEKSIDDDDASHWANIELTLCVCKVCYWSFLALSALHATQLCPKTLLFVLSLLLVVVLVVRKSMRHCMWLYSSVEKCCAGAPEMANKVISLAFYVQYMVLRVKWI
jgi:hypothetical protein